MPLSKDDMRILINPDTICTMHGGFLCECEEDCPFLEKTFGSLLKVIDKDEKEGKVISKQDLDDVLKMHGKVKAPKAEDKRADKTQPIHPKPPKA